MKLGIDQRTVRALIREKVIPAEQVVKFARWQIRSQALEEPSVVDRVRRIKTRQEVRRENGGNQDHWTLPLPGLDERPG